MAPQRFKIGQEVTLTVEGAKEMRAIVALPKVKFGEIYHVWRYWHESNDAIQPCRKGVNWYLEFSELRGYVHAEFAFAPVITSSALTELLEESLQPQTI